MPVTFFPTVPAYAYHTSYHHTLPTTPNHRIQDAILTDKRYRHTVVVVQALTADVLFRSRDEYVCCCRRTHLPATSVSGSMAGTDHSPHLAAGFLPRTEPTCGFVSYGF